MSNEKSIVVIAPETLPIPPIEGGAVQSVILEQVTRINKNITIICPRGKDQLEQETRGNLHYMRIEGSANENAHKRYRYIKKVRAVLKELNADIIHIHNRPEFIRYVPKKHKKSKILLHLHNEHLAKVDIKKLNSIVKRCHKVIFVSRFLQRRSYKHCPELKKKSVVIYNGIDLERFKPYWDHKASREKMREQYNIKNRDIVLLYVGRIVQQKGLLEIIHSMQKLKKRGARLKLVVVGSSEFGSTKMNEYERRVRNECQKIDGQIRFVGYVDHQNIPEYYQMADIFLFPIRWKEPFGLVLCEASASGIPIVSTKKGAVSEIISHKKNGLLLPPGFKPHHIISALKRIVFDKQLMKRMGRKARENMVKHFTWDQSAKKVEMLYNEG